MLNHRDARIAHQALDQALAAARHNHIDVIRHGDELTHGGTVGGCYDLNYGFRQTSRAQAFMHASGNRLIGMQRFRAAAQDRRVAGFQTQPGGVGGDVRP